MRRPAAWLIGAALAAWAAAPVRLDPLDESALPRLIASHKGKVVLVNFWATWCSPCRAEMPQLVKLEAALRDRGFRLVTVSADEPEQEPEALDFIRRSGVPMPAFIKRASNDERFIEAVDPKWSGALPAGFLYDRSGKKVRSFVGETGIAELEAAVRKLL